MRTLLLFTLLFTGAALTEAAILESITFDLTALHPGSTLSGTFTLSNSPAPGDTAPASLSFSDPTDYTPTSLGTTITILSGTPSGFAVDFSPISFTNLSGVTTPINTKDVTLTRSVFANCASFPCTASGLFQDRNPPVFTANYSIAPAAATAPEPGYALAMSILLGACFAIRRTPHRR